jgi:hypothetical protein
MAQINTAATAKGRIGATRNLKMKHPQGSRHPEIDSTSLPHNTEVKCSSCKPSKVTLKNTCRPSQMPDKRHVHVNDDLSPSRSNTESIQDLGNSEEVLEPKFESIRTEAMKHEFPGLLRDKTAAGTTGSVFASPQRNKKIKMARSDQESRRITSITLPHELEKRSRPTPVSGEGRRSEGSTQILAFSLREKAPHRS